MVDIIFPDGTTLATVMANLNVFASNPGTSEGEGEIIYNSTDNKTYVNIGTAEAPNWSDISGSGGVTDHGALTGLADDDHTQYLLVDGTRAMTAALTLGGNSIEEVNTINANTLSSYNAGKVSIVHSLVPSIDDWIDLGSSALKFNTIYANTITGISSSLNMNSNKIVGLATPTVNTDAATKLYVDGKTWDHGALTGLADDDHTQYLLVDGSRNITGDLTIDSGDNTSINVISNDAGASTLSLYGAIQGTGRLYVGQSSSYGGGIEYNGDGSPSTTGAGVDFITLWRRSFGVDYWTAKNLHSSNNWEFRGSLILSAGATVDGVDVSAIPTTYIKKDGSVAMTGALDMNNNSIEEVNTINANTLSSYNAGKVSIVHSLVPSIDDWIDLGDATHAFNTIYVNTITGISSSLNMSSQKIYLYNSGTDATSTYIYADGNHDLILHTPTSGKIKLEVGA